MHILLINVCDLTIGFYLLTIATKDAVAGDRYVESDSIWRSGFNCKIVAFVSLWSVIVETLFMMTVSITRYMVVKDPFGKPMGKRSNILILGILPILLGSLIVVTLTLRQEV